MSKRLFVHLQRLSQVIIHLFLLRASNINTIVNYIISRIYLYSNLLPIKVKILICLINTHKLDKMDQDCDMIKLRQRFNHVILFQEMRSGYTIVINISNCNIPPKIRAVGTKYELKKQLNMEISKALVNKRGTKIDNNNRHLLIYESVCTIEMIHNSNKNSMKSCRMIVWENCNTSFKYPMLKYVPAYDQLSIGGCISVGIQRSDDVFNSFGIVFSYYLELIDAYFFKSKRKLLLFDTLIKQNKIL